MIIAIILIWKTSHNKISSSPASSDKRCKRDSFLSHMSVRGQVTPDCPASLFLRLQKAASQEQMWPFRKDYNWTRNGTESQWSLQNHNGFVKRNVWQRIKSSASNSSYVHCFCISKWWWLNRKKCRPLNYFIFTCVVVKKFHFSFIKPQIN